MHIIKSAETHLGGELVHTFVFPLTAITHLDRHQQYMTTHNVCITGGEQ